VYRQLEIIEKEFLYEKHKDAIEWKKEIWKMQNERHKHLTDLTD
jgi:hypothetical protein